MSCPSFVFSVAVSVFLFAAYPISLRNYKEKEPLLFEDNDGGIKTKKSHSNTSSRSKASSGSTSNASTLFQEEQPDILLLDSVPTLHSSAASSTRTSESSKTSLWSKISHQEFDYRERNSFLLLPPPPPPRSQERKSIT